MKIIRDCKDLQVDIGENICVFLECVFVEFSAHWHNGE